MNTARDGHSVISVENRVMVVGGDGKTYNTESCVLKGDKMTCDDQESKLFDYSHIPHLFVVGHDYKDCN